MTEGLLTLKECADYLGMNYWTLWRIVNGKQRGKVKIAPPPSYRIEGRKRRWYRFKVGDVDRWRLQQTETWKKILCER